MRIKTTGSALAVDRPILRCAASHDASFSHNSPFVGETVWASGYRFYIRMVTSKTHTLDHTSGTIINNAALLILLFPVLFPLVARPY